MGPEADDIAALEAYSANAFREPWKSRITALVARVRELEALNADLHVLVGVHEERQAELEAQVEAAKSIMWMAEKYAEAGGSRGHEMRDYLEVMAAIGCANGIEEEDDE